MMETSPPSPKPPRSISEFVAVMDKAVRHMDQMLGYRGNRRFVTYFYEQRGEEVLWRDSQSYGFATGAWSTFLEEVGPVAEHYQVDVGCKGSPASHVLLIDRLERRAFFAERGEATRFLVAVAKARQEGTPEESLPTPEVPSAMVEITPEAITRLAHEIWERKGRPTGQELQDWLEAEASLKAAAQAAGGAGRRIPGDAAGS